MRQNVMRISEKVMLLGNLQGFNCLTELRKIRQSEATKPFLG